MFKERMILMYGLPPPKICSFRQRHPCRGDRSCYHDFHDGTRFCQDVPGILIQYQHESDCDQGKQYC
nr:MAG TPA: hypothetical protein [Caudoviricetes sp.]